MVQVKVTDMVPFQMHLCMKLIILFLDELKKCILQSSSSTLISIRSSFPHELSLISSSKFLAKSAIGSPLTRPFKLPSCKPLLIPLELGNSKRCIVGPLAWRTRVYLEVLQYLRRLKV